MKSFSIDAFYRGLHPAISQLNLLHWHELVNHSVSGPFYLFGDRVSCELVQQWFQHNHIELKGIIPDDSGEVCGLAEDEKVIVVYRDFPRDAELYARVRHSFKSLGLKKAYIIHDFSSGFAPGAERLIPEREQVERACGLLDDEASRDCFHAFLLNAAKPYHWNMDFTAETFGIPDPRRVQENAPAFAQTLQIPAAGYVFFCNTEEFSKNDPKLSLLGKHEGCVYFCPDRLARLRLREFCAQQNWTLRAPILNGALWNSSGTAAVSRRKWSGGTPLSYPEDRTQVQTFTADSLMDGLPEKKLEALILNMADDCIKAIEGSIQTIKRDRTTVFINGFHRADLLWNVILKLHELIPDAGIRLSRYPSENVLEGHCIQFFQRGETP